VTSSTFVPSTRYRLLDAAVAVLARDGLQALSLRVVEKEAGATHGSAAYHFATRAAMLAETLRYLASRDEQLVQRALEGHDPAAMADDDPALERASRQVSDLFMAQRPETLARYELLLYAARRPELQAEVERWHAFFADLIESMLQKLGIAQPATAARWLLAAFDGNLLHQLASPDPATAAQAPRYLQALLRAVVGVDNHPAQTPRHGS